MKKVLLVLLLLFVAACSQQTPTEQTIVTSIPPTTFLAEGLYPNATVYQLIPNGQDPHAYTLTPEDIRTIDQADIYIGIGAGLEPFGSDVESRFSDENMILLADLVGEEHEEGEHSEHGEDHAGEHEHNHGPVDPHVWMSPRRMVSALQILEGVPQTFQNNVTRLQNRYAERLETCDSRELFVTHDAYSYLAEDYGLTLHTLHGFSPHEELRPRDAARFVDEVQETGASTIFHEQQLDRRLTDRLARQAEVSVETINPALSTSDYIAVMDENVDVLARGLGCQSSQ